MNNESSKQCFYVEGQCLGMNVTGNIFDQKATAQLWLRDFGTAGNDCNSNLTFGYDENNPSRGKVTAFELITYF